MTMFGLGSACGQQNYENLDVESFATFIKGEGVTLVDVRTAEEYAEGHLAGATNIDFRQSGFLEKAKSVLDKGNKIALKQSSSGEVSLYGEKYDVTANKDYYYCTYVKCFHELL